MRYRRYLRLIGRSASERRGELREELESHIAMRADDLMRAGETSERARRIAESQFGDMEAVFLSARERDRMLRRRDWLSGVQRDVRLAARQARRRPGAALLAVLTFALGIGLTTAMFTIVDGVLLRPLPYADPDRLVVVQGMDSAGNVITTTSYANWRDLAERNNSLAHVALHQSARVTIDAEDGAYRVPALMVTPAFFDVLGTNMLTGRGFVAEDAEPGSGAVVVSESLWRRELGGRPAGDLTLRVGGMPRTVVGVIADEDAFSAGARIWVPWPEQQRVGGFFRNYIGHEAIARLRDGVTLERAEADLGAIARQIQAAEPESDYMYGAPLRLLHDRVVGASAGYLQLLMGAVTIVLLLACANLAALNLARASTRSTEIAMRYALGASRGAVVRQLVTEQLVLALAGGALGVLLAWFGTGAVLRAAATHLPRATEIGLDLRVLLFALAASLFAGILSGIIPAWKAAGASERSLIGGRGTVQGGRGIPGAVLVGGEIAVAVLLLIAAGLLVRSFQSVLSRDMGYAPDGVVAAELALTGDAYRAPEARVQQWEELLAQIAAEPSIAAAAVANWIPTANSGTGYLVVDGFAQDETGAGYDVVSEGYFDALGVPLLLGRTFAASDAADGERVSLVNRTLAERYWPDESPIGRRLKVPGMEGPRETAPWITVIGVVGDVRQDGYEDVLTANRVYVLYRQVPSWTNAMTLIARDAGGNADAAAAVLRRNVRAMDPTIAVEPRSMQHRLGELVTERRLVMSVLSGFGLLALLLAVIGVYGMLSFAVAERTREIGIRTALGADHGGIIRLIMRNAASVVVPGAAVGLVAAWWLTRVVESMLVDVTRTDPLAWAGAITVLCVIAFIAALIPARRAARVDPLVALRNGA